VSDSGLDARHEMKRGLWWMGGATVAMRALDLAGTFFVLKYLTRAEVGLATICWSIAVVLEAFNGLGVGVVVVRRRDLTHRHLSGLFWFATLVGMGAVVLTAVAAPWLAGFYRDARLPPMIVASALKVVFVGAALVPLQLLVRDLKFREAGAAQTLATLGEAVTKISLILAGFGAWALVLANTARGLALLLAVWWLAPFRPARTLALRPTLLSLRFGLPLAASSVIYQAYRNADFLLIGRILGNEVLGVYRVAFDLGMTALDIIVNLISRVQLPIYARLRGAPGQLADAFTRSVRSLILLLGPPAALLTFASGDLLRAISGNTWLTAVPLVQILCWASLLRGVAMLFPQIYEASGHPRLVLFDTLISGGTLVLGFALALTLAPPALGALAVAWAWLLTYPPVLVAHFFMVRPCAPITASGVAHAVRLPVLGLALMAAVLALTSALLPSGRSPLLGLAALITVGVGAYISYLRLVLGLRLSDLLPGRAAAP
jgi:O-antigen/teichoic acid export membrane protein